MKKRLTLPLAFLLVVSAFPFSACTDNRSGNVLRIASWDEYIDEGSDGGKPLYEEFEDWYLQEYGEEITVEYLTLQDNETMYNKIKMGDHYDLLCPSEYMIMKLAAEDKLEKFDESFFDKTDPNNYYVRNVSPYIESVFQRKLSNGHSWSEYAAGYMWGTTGFVFNSERVDREDVKNWNVFLNEKYDRKITAKDNVRDSYFAGLGMYYENELRSLKNDLAAGTIDLETYQTTLSTKMNDTNVMTEVQKLLEKMRGNLYGLETDEGKLDVITGRFDISYQWSGDAVYILDMSEDEEITSSPVDLEYCIPESTSNLWFDGWVMMKGSDEKIQKAALAFINFLSMPENAIRNMDYIGYTSCIAGDAVFDYVKDKYGAEDDEEETDVYDLTYFFGNDAKFQAPLTQFTRQLFAQYPTEDIIDRLVIMEYFDKATNERANRMWNNIK